MSITTYAELQTYLNKLLARDGDSNVTDYTPDFIKMGEQELNARLRIREMITTVNINPDTTNKYVSLPTGFMKLVSFTDPLGYPMREKSMEEIEALRYSSGSGYLRYYHFTNRIEFDRAESVANRDYPMTYWKYLDLATDLTNDVLTKYPNLYVYTACVHAAPWIHDDDRIATFATLAKELLETLNDEHGYSEEEAETDFSGSRFNIIQGR